MPEETGIETYQSLSNIDPNVNVIFMSGLDDRNSLPTIQNFKSCAFIKKPFSLDEITEKVAQCMSADYTRPVSNFQKN
jgi:DNA-binding NtrC family response regulator